jgi:hypothetical protein
MKSSLMKKKEEFAILVRIFGSKFQIEVRDGDFRTHDVLAENLFLIDRSSNHRFKSSLSLLSQLNSWMIS